MNVLIISDSIVYEQDSEYYSQDTFFKFIHYLTANFTDITVFTPVQIGFPKDKTVQYINKNGNKKLLKIERAYPHKRVINYYKCFPLILYKNLYGLLRNIPHSDIIFLRIPAMNTFLAVLLASIYKKPIVSYFVGDETSVIAEGNKYKGFNLKLALYIAKIHKYLYKKIVKISKVSFFLSYELRDIYNGKSNNSYFIFTSLIEKKDIHYRVTSNKYYDYYTLLYVGRLSYEKGLKYLIDSMQLLIKDNYKIKLIICGDGPERDNLQNIIHEMNIGQHVYFKGFVSWGKELFKIYSESDLFILPSVSEGVPKVLLEAMAMGVPVIATSVGGIPNIIRNMDNGLLVLPRNPHAIRDAVKLLIENKSLREQIVNNGYDFIIKHTAEKQAKKISQIIYKHVYDNIEQT